LLNLELIKFSVFFLLILSRSGGNWSTTYAPSPFYMTSKMRSLYLEGYDYSIFDLTKPDRVQIQVPTGLQIFQSNCCFSDKTATIIELIE
jgi:hypothetical protein